MGPPQRISACDDKDFEATGLHPFQGRGATELDVLEGAVTNTGVASYSVGSVQLSPGVPPYFRPPLFGFPTAKGAGSWYTGMTFGSGGTSYTDGFINNGWYGPPWGEPCPTGCPDALSGGLVELDDLDTKYCAPRATVDRTGSSTRHGSHTCALRSPTLPPRHVSLAGTYRMEWETGPNGHIGWYYNDVFVWQM